MNKNIALAKPIWNELKKMIPELAQFRVKKLVLTVDAHEIPHIALEVFVPVPAGKTEYKQFRLTPVEEEAEVANVTALEDEEEQYASSYPATPGYR